MTTLLLDLLALVGGTVHSLVPGEPPRPATVLIRDQRIEKLLPPEAELPPDCRRIDVTGKHVLPGLIDALVNFDKDHDALYVHAGVTTVRDIGGDMLKTLYEQRPALRDRVPGPSLLTGGAIIDGDPPSAPEALVLKTAADAERLLPALFENRVDFVSIHDGLTEEPWRKTIELAHGRELAVWGPIPRAVTLEQALAAGQDGIH